MEVKASLKHLRMSARKVRLVVDLVRGLKTDKALNQLRFLNKLAARPVEKLIKSAIANAVNNFSLDENNLMIKEIKVNEGVTLKRWMPKAHGSATKIRKRGSHILLALGEIKDSGKKEGKKIKLEAPMKLGGSPKQPAELKGKSKKEDDKKNIPVGHEKELGHEIIDPRGEGHGKHVKTEGGTSKGFLKKMFNRKSG
jgi:large subunit ribosomal protein L22